MLSCIIHRRSLYIIMYIKQNDFLLGKKSLYKDKHCEGTFENNKDR